MLNAELMNTVGNFIYAAQALVALWGIFCVVFVWTRVGQKRFRNEQAQIEFLQALEGPLQRGEFEAAELACEGDTRVVPQLTHLAVTNRSIGFDNVRQLVVDRFQRDLMADLEYRVSWINTVIKTEPMLGLFGTVTGMMGAFGKLASAENVKPDMLASDIAIALITTAIGLAISIPLIMAMASINVRIRKMEDLAIAGLTRVLESFKIGLGLTSKRAK